MTSGTHCVTSATNDTGRTTEMETLIFAGLIIAAASALFIWGMRTAGRACIRYTQWTDDYPDASEEGDS
jgi:hypothetical protein